MNERRDDLQEIIDKALEEMAAEAGDGFDPQACNLAEFCRRTGLTRSKARTIRKHGFRALPHGNSGRRAEVTVLTGHTGLVDDQLRRGVTNSQVIYERLLGQGYEGGLTAVKVYISGHRDLVPAKRRTVAPQGSRGQRFRTGPGEAYQMDWGFVTVVDPGGTEYRIACFAMVCHHCGSFYVEFFPNARQENLLIGMLHAFMAMGVPGEVLTDNMKSVVTGRDLDGRPVWQRDYAAFMGCEGQGRAADPLREGQLPRRPRLHRHHHAQRGGAAVVRGAGWQVEARRGLRAVRGARVRLPPGGAPARGDRRGRALAVPQAQDHLRRLRQLRGPEVRGPILVRAAGLPREPRGWLPAHIQRRPGPGAGRARRDLGPARQLVRGAVGRRAARGASQPARHHVDLAGRARARQARVRKVRLREVGVMGNAAKSPYELASEAAARLGIALAASELATLASDHDMGDAEVGALAVTFDYLAEKRRQASIETLLRLSRLPRREPKTFDGFDFSRIQGRDASALAKLPALADLYAHRNVAFIGPGGIGKTHLAQAYGRECCMRGLKTYYVKASELRDRFQRAAERGSASRVVATLVKPTCLIVDEVGRCTFDRACTDLFFDVIDRRYEKEGPNTMILTSNVAPSAWDEFFTGDDALLCALDRVFDKASVFMMRGPSYRGRELDTYSVEAVPQATKVRGMQPKGV